MKAQVPPPSPQILRGVDNPLSRAAARGEPTGHLLSAAAADLDALQSLAVESDRLVRWITESVGGLPDGWATAAATSLAPTPRQPHGGGGTEAAFALPPRPPEALCGPLSPTQRAAARALVGGWQRWSGAVESLQLYYACYGHGLLPGHRVLLWSGKLEGQDALRGEQQQQPPTSYRGCPRLRSLPRCPQALAATGGCRTHWRQRPTPMQAQMRWMHLLSRAWWPMNTTPPRRWSPRSLPFWLLRSPAPPRRRRPRRHTPPWWAHPWTAGLTPGELGTRACSAGPASAVP